MISVMQLHFIWKRMKIKNKTVYSNPLFFPIVSKNKCIYVRYLILFLDTCLTALIDPLSHTKRLTKGTSASLQTK